MHSFFTTKSDVAHIPAMGFEPRKKVAPTYCLAKYPTASVFNAITVQLSRIMSILLTGNIWIVSTRVICGDDYAIISWREVMVKRSAVRRQEINTPLPSNVVIGA